MSPAFLLYRKGIRYNRSEKRRMGLFCLHGNCYNDRKVPGAEVVGMAIELKRDIYEELLQWKKNNSGLVLEVEGARQLERPISWISLPESSMSNIFISI